MIPRCFARLLMAAALLWSSTAHPAGNLPPSFEVSYSLFSKGARIARMHRVFRPLAGGLYQFRSETKTTGLIALFRKDHIIEESTWSLNEDMLRPLRYSYQHSGGSKDRHVAVRFDWHNRRITNTVNGESWLMPTEPEVMDKLLYQFAIMYDLNSGRTPARYTIADGGKIKSYDFEPLGEETIETPLGPLRTLKFARRRQDSDRETTLWCAPALEYLPVRVENVEKDGRATIAVIDSVTGLAACEAGGTDSSEADTRSCGR